jgi:two-component system CheB/CheR fusion protein
MSDNIEHTGGSFIPINAMPTRHVPIVSMGNGIQRLPLLVSSVQDKFNRICKKYKMCKKEKEKLETINEELETKNEELKTKNEELKTKNEELQNKINEFDY